MPDRLIQPVSVFERSLVLSLIATICLAWPAVAGDVQVRVTGLKNAEGDVRVAICTEDEFLSARCTLSGVGAASASSVTILNVPPGRYAVQAFHDENGNGRLDRTSLRRPLEGLGFSRDAPMRFGPPRYRDAVVEVPPDGGTLSLTMRYY